MASSPSNISTMRSVMMNLGIACLLTSSIPFISALQAGNAPRQSLDVLFQRDLTCANSTLSSCSSVDPKLPGDFCCMPGTQCISLDSSSSALCCPGNCATIHPISCDVALQNPITNPGTGFLTTRLGDSLPHCGSNSCCPFGYKCGREGNIDVCSLDNTTSIVGTGSSSSTSSATSTRSSTSSTATSTGTASGIDSNQTQPIKQCAKFPGAAVAAGFFPGMLAGALLMFLGWLFFQGRRSDSRPSSRNSSLYKPRYPVREADGTITGVSAPMPLDSNSARTDFLHRTTMRAKSIFSSARSDTGQNALPYQENWKMPTPPTRDNIPMQAYGGLVPVTPQRQTRSDRYATKQPSSESIRVYSPPGMSRPPGPPIPVRNPDPLAPQPNRSEIGSPFKTPPANKYTYPDEPVSPVADRGETLTPARYNDGRKRDEEDEADEDFASRPTTTFTTMLANIGLPDPGRSPTRTPAVPEMPKGLGWSKKGKGR